MRNRPILPRSSGPILLVVLLLGVCSPIFAARAQGPSGESAAEAAAGEAQSLETDSGPIALGEVPAAADRTRAALARLLPSSASQQALEAIDAKLDEALPNAEALVERSRSTLEGQPNVQVLRDLESQLSLSLDQLRPWDERIDQALAGFSIAIAELDILAARWKATAELARGGAAGATTTSRIRDMRGEIEARRAELLVQRNQILKLRDRTVDPSTALRGQLEQVQRAIGSRLEGIYQIDRAPIWSAEVRESLREELEWGGSRAFSRARDGLHEHATQSWRLLALQLLLFAALLVALQSIQNRARARAEDDYDLRDAKEVFELPGAMALLITLLVTFSMLRAAPDIVRLAAGVLIGAAVLSIGRRFLVPALRPLAWGVVFFYLVDLARLLLEETPTIERCVFLVEMAAALAIILVLQRRSRLAEIPRELQQAAFLRILGLAMRAAAALLVIAILADIAGLSDLASLLGGGALRGAYVGFFTFVLLKVFSSLAAFLLVLRPLRLLRAVSRHRLLVRRRTETILTLMSVGFWTSRVLGPIGLLGPARTLLENVLGAAFEVGAVSISLGDVLLFVLTVWLSFVLARFVDFILQEDVFTRVQTARGVPYAVSGLVRYTLIFLGFLLGLAAAGVELSKLTIVAGGLGVGIGFGLQNVVNNFVSGLILLFERPIQVGDAVQLTDTWGNIKRIGIRASVLRTFDGADVIVPNGMLISERVTNWTFADKRRRVELKVGVEYGTSARRVIELLVETASGVPGVLAEPAPRAFFLGFGDSSLDFELRAWIADFDEGYSARSNLAVAVQEALAEANIGIPFPQRDLHVVSVSPDASRAVLGRTNPELRAGAAPESPEED